MQNRIHRCTTLPVRVTPTTADAGDPVLFPAGGPIRGYAAKDADSLGRTVMELAHESLVVRDNVLASTDDTTSVLAGASALNLGDAVYLNTSTGLLSKDSGGTVLFGYALGARDSDGYYDDAADPIVAAGASGECDIILV